MDISLWLHGKSLVGPSYSSEKDWLIDYGAELKSFFSEVKKNNSLEEQAPTTDFIHVFGSGCYESLIWLKNTNNTLWYSPFPFRSDQQNILPPKRAFFGKKFSDQAGLKCVDWFLIPNWAKGQARAWGIPNDHIVYLDNPTEIRDHISKLLPTK